MNFHPPFAMRPPLGRCPKRRREPVSGVERHSYAPKRVVPKAADVTNSLRNVPNVCSTGSPIVNRPHELEIMRRSVAMLTPGATAQLTREEAMRLIAEVKEA